MEITVKNKEHNKLLEREEIALIVKSETTPRAGELKKDFAGKLNFNEELVAIKKIKGNFGKKEFDVEAYAYDNKEALGKHEQKPKAKKEAKQEEKAEEKKEEKAEEKAALTEKKAG